MAVQRLTYQSTVSATGWTGAGNVASSDDVRATDGVAGEILDINLADAPGDYHDTNSGNTVQLRVEARTVGTNVRTKQITLDLLDSGGSAVLDSGGAAITFSTGDLTASDAVYESGLITLPDNYTAANVDGWRLRATVTEGGGMPDSATVEIDEMSVNLDYDLAPSGVSGSGGGIIGTLAAVGVAAALITGSGSPSLPGLSASGAGTAENTLTRTTVGLLVRRVANDATNPMSAGDWEAQANADALSLDGATGGLDFSGTSGGEAGSWFYVRFSALAARTKAAIQYVYEGRSGSPNEFHAGGYFESGAAGNQMAGAWTTIGGATEFSGVRERENFNSISSTSTTGDTTAKSLGPLYRLTALVDDGSVASHDFSQGLGASKTVDVLTAPGSMGIHAHTSGVYRLHEWWIAPDWVITCIGLPTGHKLKVLDSAGAVLKSETEVSGTATMDLRDVSWPAIASVVVTDASDVILRAFVPGSGEWVTGGDSYEFGPTTISGSGGPSLPALNASGTGDVAVEGTGSPSFPVLSGTGTGTTLVEGTGSPALPALSASGAGTVASNAISGSGSPSLPALAGSGVGAVLVEGTGDPALPALTGSGSGTGLVEGTGAPSLPGLASTGVGVPLIEGTGSAALPALSSSGSGTVAIEGAGTPSLPALTGSGTGILGSAISGAGSPSLPALTAAGAGQIAVDGTGTPDLPGLSAAGAGAVRVEGAGNPSLPSLAGSGAAAASVVGTGSPVLPVLTGTGSGDVAVIGAGSPQLPALAAAGEGTAPAAHALAPSVRIARVRPESRVLTVPSELRTLTVRETRILTVIGGK